MLLASLAMHFHRDDRRGDPILASLFGRIEQAAEHKALAASRHGADNDEFYLKDVTCRVRLQLPEHLVAVVSTGLDVSARGVATRECDIGVLCLAQTPVPLAGLVKSYPKEWVFLALVSGFAISSSFEFEVQRQIDSFPEWSMTTEETATGNSFTASTDTSVRWRMQRIQSSRYERNG